MISSTILMIYFPVDYCVIISHQLTMKLTKAVFKLFVTLQILVQKNPSVISERLMAMEVATAWILHESLLEALFPPGHWVFEEETHPSPPAAAVEEIPTVEEAPPLRKEPKVSSYWMRKLGKINGPRTGLRQDVASEEVPVIQQKSIEYFSKVLD